MADLKGTKTEKNLMQAFAGLHLQENHKQETNTHILQAKLKRKDMSKLLQYSKKQQIMKKNMQKCGLNY